MEIISPVDMARPEPIVPKILLIFYSEFPKLLLYYSLRVDPLFHEILLTVSQNDQNKHARNIRVTQILHKTP